MSKVAGKSKDRRLMCPKCGWSNIRPSLRHGIIDGLLSIARLAPFRCRNCRHRFYRFSRRMNGFTPVESTSPQPARPLSILVEPAPISKPMAVAQSPSRQMTPDPEEPRSILVVDSDLSIRSLLCRVLEREGYRIHELPQTSDLLRELHAIPFDLLITDLDTPQQQGLETIGTLTSEFPALKVILLSGSFKARSLPENVALLPKPFRIEALLERVRVALSAAEAWRAVR